MGAATLLHACHGLLHLRISRKLLVLVAGPVYRSSGQQHKEFSQVIKLLGVIVALDIVVELYLIPST